MEMSIDVAHKRLEYYRWLHRFFYREYVESGDEEFERDQNALIMSLRAKAMFYRLQNSIIEPTNVIFYN